MAARPARSIGTWLPYALAAVMAVVLIVVTVSRGGTSEAAKDALGGKQLKLMAPADPGGGWDSTARAMQEALEGIVGRSEVYNVSGAGGDDRVEPVRQLQGPVQPAHGDGPGDGRGDRGQRPQGQARPGHADRGAGQRGAAGRRTQGLTDQGRRRPEGGDAEGRRESRLGRRLGRGSGADPCRPDREGPRGEPRGRQLHRTLRWRRGHRDAAEPQGHGRGQQRERVQAAASTPASCDPSPWPVATASTS